MARPPSGQRPRPGHAPRRRLRGRADGRPGHHHGELGTLRLLGSTRREILRTAGWEARLVAAGILVLGMAAVTLPARAALHGETLEQ